MAKQSAAMIRMERMMETGPATCARDVSDAMIFETAAEAQAAIEAGEAPRGAFVASTMDDLRSIGGVFILMARGRGALAKSEDEKFLIGLAVEEGMGAGWWPVARADTPAERRCADAPGRCDEKAPRNPAPHAPRFASMPELRAWMAAQHA